MNNTIPYNPFCNVNSSMINKSWMHTYAKYKREWTTLSDVVGTFLIIFGARMNILFMTKDKILELIKQSYGSPQICRSSSLEWLLFFEHIVQCFKNVSFWYSFGTIYPSAPIVLSEVPSDGNQCSFIRDKRRRPSTANKTNEAIRPWPTASKKPPSSPRLSLAFRSQEICVPSPFSVDHKHTDTHSLAPRTHRNTSESHLQILKPLIKVLFQRCFRITMHAWASLQYWKCVLHAN